MTMRARLNALHGPIPTVGTFDTVPTAITTISLPSNFIGPGEGGGISHTSVVTGQPWFSLDGLNMVISTPGIYACRWSLGFAYTGGSNGDSWIGSIGPAIAQFAFLQNSTIAPTIEQQLVVVPATTTEPVQPGTWIETVNTAVEMSIRAESGGAATGITDTGFPVFAITRLF